MTARGLLKGMFCLTMISQLVFDVTGFLIQSPRGLSHSSRIVGTDSVFDESSHPAIRNQRSSLAPVQTQGLFGLGAGELAIIAIVAVVLIGPSTLSRSVGEFAGQAKNELDQIEDLKRIPEEFKKGVEEGEINARSRKAKQMDRVPVDKNSQE